MKQQFDFSIAGVHGRMVVEEETWIYENFKRKFDSYKSQGNPYFNIDVKGSFPCELDLDNQSAPHHPIVVESSGKQLTIVEAIKKTKTRILGTIDPETRHCRIFLEHASDYSRLFSAVRACYHYFLEKSGGFLLHASSGTLNGKTFLFTGQSGAGKTTALLNLNPDAIVTQDAAAIRINGEKSLIFAMPFKNDKNAMGQIDAVFFPKKTQDQLRTRKTSFVHSIYEIISNTLFASPDDPVLVNPVLETITCFCATVPGYNLYFGRHENLNALRKLLA